MLRRGGGLAARAKTRDRLQYYLYKCAFSLVTAESIVLAVRWFHFRLPPVAGKPNDRQRRQWCDISAEKTLSSAEIDCFRWRTPNRGGRDDGEWREKRWRAESLWSRSPARTWLGTWTNKVCESIAAQGGKYGNNEWMRMMCSALCPDIFSECYLSHWIFLSIRSVLPSKFCFSFLSRTLCVHTLSRHTIVNTLSLFARPIIYDSWVFREIWITARMCCFSKRTAAF